MLHLIKLKPTLNTQENSELFTLIIRNVQLDDAITRDFEKSTEIIQIKQYNKIDQSIFPF